MDEKSNMPPGAPVDATRCRQCHGLLDLTPPVWPNPPSADWCNAQNGVYLCWRCVLAALKAETC